MQARNEAVVLRPLPRTVEDAIDFNNAFPDTVDRQKRQFGDSELSGTRFSARPPFVRGDSQRFHSIVDRECGPARLGWAKVFSSVVADVCEVVKRWLGPANEHQPGYRLSISSRTIACSTHSPRSAAAKPWSTSRENQSS